jgi:hypothetical protein
MREPWLPARKLRTTRKISAQVKQIQIRSRSPSIEDSNICFSFLCPEAPGRPSSHINSFLVYCVKKQRKMLSETDLLKQVAQRLECANIPYMLTGSLAANFYAVPRMTRDIDIVIELQFFDAKKIIQLFKDDFYVSNDSIHDAIKHQTMFNIIHNESILKIDFIIRKNETYRDTEFKRRKQVLLDETQIWIVAPEDLIISKLCWAKDSRSTTQLNDIRNIFQTTQDLDNEYIQKWVKDLELVDIYQKVRSNA